MDVLFWIFATFTALGVAGTMFIIVYFFTAIGKNARTLRIEHTTQSVDTLGFLYTIASITKQSPAHIRADEIKILSENADFFAALLRDIEQASFSIAIHSYVWKEDEMTTQIFEALAAAVGRGVTVRLLIDSVGSKLSQPLIDSLREKGIDAQIFRPFSVGKVAQFSARSHRRAYIFDECIAYIGGSSISEAWFKKRTTETHAYSDIMYRTSGSGVFSIMCAFHELWIATTGEIIQMRYESALAMEEGNKNPPTSNFVSLSHTPQIDVHPLTYTFWYALACAQKEIILCTPYFVPGSRLVHLLIERARAGVAITLITQGTDELWFVRDTARQYYKDLLDAGIKIEEFKEPHLHTKMIVIDRTLTIFGSANIDIRSQRINNENLLIIQDTILAEKNIAILTSYFECCEEVTASTVDSWPWLRRQRAKLSRIFSEQF